MIRCFCLVRRLQFAEAVPYGPVRLPARGEVALDLRFEMLSADPDLRTLVPGSLPLQDIQSRTIAFS